MRSTISKVISVTLDRAGRTLKFGGDASDLHDTVAEKMKAFLSEDSAPRYLDETARDLFAEGRAAFRRYGLSRRASIIAGESSTILFMWRGTVATQSLAMALVAQGLSATPKQIAIEISNSHGDVIGTLREFSSGATPTALSWPDI